MAAIILLQTLFFKFTAAPESVYIFTRLEPSLGAGSAPAWWSSSPLFCY